MAVDIPWPTDNNPGLRASEGSGRLINVFAEPRTSDKAPVWRRAPGATVFARSPSSGSASIEIAALGRGETLMSTFFSLVGSTFAQYATSGATTFAFPQDAAADDVLFMAYAADTTTSLTTPSGWTAIGTTVSFMAANLMYKVSTGETGVAITVPDPASVILSFGIRGAMTTAPIVDTATISTGASGDPAPPNFTNTTADSLMINVSWQDDDAASAVAAPSTITIAAATTFGLGGHLFAVTTGANGTDAATVMVGMRPLATTGAITASTWAVTGGDDEWASISFTMRHD